MIKFFMIVAALFVSGTARAEMTPLEEMPAGVYRLDRTHATFLWKVGHSGLSNYIGRFTSFDVELDFDPLDVTASHLDVRVDPMSLATDYPYPEKKDFSKKLATSDKWLNAGVFPDIHFVATSVQKTGDKAGQITGELEFLGVKKPVTLDVVFNGAYASKPFVNVPALGFSAKGVLKRSDWGLDTYIPSIGDEVELEIEVELELHGAAAE